MSAARGHDALSANLHTRLDNVRKLRTYSMVITPSEEDATTLLVAEQVAGDRNPLRDVPVSRQKLGNASLS